MNKLDLLESVLGYKFNDSAFLSLALVHSSYNNTVTNNNQRMEFLGDSILGFVIAEIIYEYYKNQDEGYLSKSLSYLTSRDVLSSIGRQLKLEDYIKHKSNYNDNLIADALEAIICAIYFDINDVKVIKDFVLKHWKNHLQSYTVEDTYIHFNPRSFLQDWAQKQQLPIPEYIQIKRDGTDHEPLFHIQLLVYGYDSVIGMGKNKKIAQKAAAQKFIDTHNLK